MPHHFLWTESYLYRCFRASFGLVTSISHAHKHAVIHKKNTLSICIMKTHARTLAVKSAQTDTHLLTHRGYVLTCESLLSALISFSRSDPCHHSDRVADISPVLPGLSVSVQPPASLAFSAGLFLYLPFSLFSCSSNFPRPLAPSVSSLFFFLTAPSNKKAEQS